VEPDLVTRMRLGGSSDGHFSYGPSFPGLSREPFSSERHLFSDSQLHTCGPYLEMEKKFFSDNAAIVREFYFDADLLLGVDPDEDLAVEEAVNYDDLVPVLSAEEILWQIAAVNHISNVEIVRLAPVNSDSENEETMERVTSPVVVEAVGELADAVGCDFAEEAVVWGVIMWETLLRAGLWRLPTPGLPVGVSVWTTFCLGQGLVPSRF